MSTAVFAVHPLDRINEPPAPMRLSMAQVGLEELAASIQNHGQLQPIGVVPDGERFTIIYGHRRFCALQLLGDRPAQCLVYASTSEAMLGAQIDENAVRQDTTPAEEALWFAQLLEGLQCDTNELSDRLKRPRAYIEGRLALLSGDPLVFEAVKAGGISLGVAHALNDCSEELTRRMFLDAAMKREATVRTVTQWIAEWKASGALASRIAESVNPKPAETPGPVADYTPRCTFCDDTDNAWMLEHEWIHSYCKKGRDRLLAAALGERIASGHE